MLAKPKSAAEMRDERRATTADLGLNPLRRSWQGALMRLKQRVLHRWNMYRLGISRPAQATRRAIVPVAVICFVTGSAVFAWLAPTIHLTAAAQTETDLGYSEQLGSCTVTDGDTIRCGRERIRLLGIDAPELPGHCRRGRECAPGDPYASKASLDDALSGHATIERVGEDRYGRTLARVAADNGDLSCWQLTRKQAIYKPKWDNGLRIARTCPRSTLGF
jgi:micrococcal nuclease